MAEDRRLDQVEAVREDVRSQEGVHRIQLDENVGQKHHLHSNVEEGKVIAMFSSTTSSTKQTRGVLIAHFA